MTTLDELRQQIAVCTRCELHRGATNPVPGEGNPQARILLIGEAPGFHEDAQGKPFVGTSGKFLTELLQSAGLSRDDVFITNVVKHRPPGNRDPLPDEIYACSHFLKQQVEIINPDVIVTLGRFSMAAYFPGERISRIHGKAKEVDGRLIVPMYHPAAALHNGALRPEIEADFQKLPRLLAEREATRAKSDPIVRQQSLF
ncbi:MAG: uracil-DNA glycosylase [Thermomicrobiales bacterium]|nr:uracil-DNA glycosylase [Thermomicrobiales bacterium]